MYQNAKSQPKLSKSRDYIEQKVEHLVNLPGEGALEGERGGSEGNPLMTRGASRGSEGDLEVPRGIGGGPPDDEGGLERERGGP